MIRYSSDALADVERLHAWLAARDLMAAARFVERLEEALALVARAPSRWPASGQGRARRYILRFGRSRYVLHFVEDGQDVVIVRLWHSRENRPA